MLDVIYINFILCRKQLGHKIRLLGIGENVHKWVSNWLSDSDPILVCTSNTHPQFSVTNGVPEGLVSDPIYLLEVWVHNW